MGLTHSSPGNRNPLLRRRSSTNVIVSPPVHIITETSETDPIANQPQLQQDRTLPDQEFPIRRRMYFPFSTQNTSDLPPPESWYDELQNNSSHTADADGETGRTQNNEVSLRVALAIVNELAELSAWLQRQSSALEVSNHITFDAEGRPVFDFSTPIRGGPAAPVLPPSYGRATLESMNRPSLDDNSRYPTEDYRRFLNRYSAIRDDNFTQFATPPPSYSRATSQQCNTPSQTLPTPEEPPPSYTRAVRDHRERPTIDAIIDVSQVNSQNNNYISNIAIGY